MDHLSMIASLMVLATMIATYGETLAGCTCGTTTVTDLITDPLRRRRADSNPGIRGDDADTEYLDCSACLDHKNHFFIVLELR